MKTGKWVAVTVGLIMLISYPFYMLKFLYDHIFLSLNNVYLLNFILAIPLIIDAVILWLCRGREPASPTGYRILYVLNFIVLIIMLVVYSLFI